MGEKIRVRVHGGDALAIRLKQLGINTSKVLEVAVTAAAKVIEDAAEPMAPGPNIDHQTKERKPQSVTVAVGPDAKHWYYRFAEFGAGPHGISGPLVFEGEGGEVVRMSVQHPGRAQAAFLRPAADTQGEKAQDAMGQVLKTAIESV